jgi:sensor histidine kinase YesM
MNHPMQETLRKFGLVILISGGTGNLFYTYLHFSETSSFPKLPDNFPGFLASAAIGCTIGFILYFFNRMLNRWVPWKNSFALRFITGYITNILLALTICFSLTLLIIQIWRTSVFWSGLSVTNNDIIWKTGILFTTSLFIYTVIYALLYSYQQYAVAQIENLQGERKQLELQFEALKSQISPHYLFNSLNTISSLIYNDPQSAEQFIRRLAQTYQYILSSQNKKYVLLRDEVEFVQSYYYLLRIRFQQMLSIDINLPSNVMDSQMPPLTLQMLVENAVKHNTISSETPLFIYITALDNTHLKIINTKSRQDLSVNSFKVGLENIKKRYAYFTDRKIEVRNDEKFMVSLPVISNQHKPDADHLKHKFSA